MANFFQFEADFVDSLRCIPMQVRYKLDTCGIKLKLSDWNQMSISMRETLMELPCTTANEIQLYHEYLLSLILELTGKPATQILVEPSPPWLDTTAIPLEFQEKAKEIGATMSLQKWESLTNLQRFALLKLCRSGHENKNFAKAMAEFDLLS